MLKENNVRKGFFDRDQLESVVKHLRPHNVPPAIFAYITGWRKGEILSLKWPQVDFAAGIVRLRESAFDLWPSRMLRSSAVKGNTLPSSFFVVPGSRQAGIICPWVFFSEEEGKRKGWPIGDWKRNWRTACRTAGVPARIFQTSAGPPSATWSASASPRPSP